MASKRSLETKIDQVTRGSTVDLGEEVLRSLRRIIRATYLHSKKLQSTVGLTAPQLVILRELVGGRELSGSQLASSVSLSPPTVAGILSRLESRGLIHRHRSERDKRQLLVRLTAEGEELLARAPPPLQEQFSDNMAKLADWEQSQILATLQRIVALMEVESVDASPFLTTSPDIQTEDVPSSPTE